MKSNYFNLWLPEFISLYRTIVKQGKDGTPKHPGAILGQAFFWQNQKEIRKTLTCNFQSFLLANFCAKNQVLLLENTSDIWKYIRSVKARLKLLLRSCFYLLRLINWNLRYRFYFSGWSPHIYRPITLSNQNFWLSWTAESLSCHYPIQNCANWGKNGTYICSNESYESQHIFCGVSIFWFYIRTLHKLRCSACFPFLSYPTLFPRAFFVVPYLRVSVQCFN